MSYNSINIYIVHWNIHASACEPACLPLLLASRSIIDAIERSKGPFTSIAATELNSTELK